MLFIPSDEIQTRLINERVGVFADYSENAPHNWLLAKLPMSALRIIHAGAGTSLSVWVTETDGGRIAALGLIVHDDPFSPICIFGACRNHEEVNRLHAVLSSGAFPLQFYNENTLPILYASCRVEVTLARPVIDLLPTVLLQDSQVVRLQANDAIEEWVRSGSSLRVIAHCALPIALDQMETQRIEVIGSGEVGLNVLDEGGELEKLAFQNLEHIYPFGTFLNPWVGEGKSRRELCDVLAVSRTQGLEEEGIIVVQSKVASSDASALVRSADRKVRNIKHNIMAAIRQLIGAIRDLRGDSKIFHADGRPIEEEQYPDASLDLKPLLLRERASKTGHGIVLVSEMHELVDWPSIFDALKNASAKTGYMCQVLDLHELGQIVLHSQQPAVFECRLIERWEAMIKSKNALVRCKFV